MAAAAPIPAEAAQPSRLMALWRQYRKNRLGVLGLIILTALLLAALLAPMLVAKDPYEQTLANRRTPPGENGYVLGADEFGRDMLARVLYGGRLALRIAVISVGVGLTMGVTLGATAGYVGGWLDELLMRGFDIMLAFPYLLLAIAIVSALGPGEFNTMLAIGIWATPSFARITRGAILSIKERDFVLSAKAIGMTDLRIVIRHLLPNTISAIVIFGSLFMARAILLEASLSFLGLGAQPPEPSWGQMVSTGRNVLRTAPHMSVVPGVAIMLAVLAFNLVGEGLRDALDPKMKDS